MKYFFISSLIYFVSFLAFSQDLYDPELIKTLNVKTKKVIKTGAVKDTMEYHYDREGRLVYKKEKKYGKMYVDSLFYERNRLISKRYSTKGTLKSTEETKFDKKGNIVRFERNQILPVADKSGYESVYKNGQLISSKSFRNGEVIKTWSWKESAEKDTAYSYHSNNSEISDFYDGEGIHRKKMGSVAFNDSGKIVWSINYVNIRPYEVSVIERRYDDDSKTYNEVINKEYYYSNGLQMKKVDNEYNMTTTYFYEFY